MNKRDAFIIMRVMVRIEQQIERAHWEGRTADACGIADIFGRISFQQFDLSLLEEL